MKDENSIYPNYYNQEKLNKNIPLDDQIGYQRYIDLLCAKKFDNSEVIIKHGITLTPEPLIATIVDNRGKKHNIDAIPGSFMVKFCVTEKNGSTTRAKYVPGKSKLIEIKKFDFREKDHKVWVNKGDLIGFMFLPKQLIYGNGFGPNYSEAEENASLNCLYYNKQSLKNSKFKTNQNLTTQLNI